MGKKKRPQGKPQEMSLAEFNKKTPVNMALPRGGGTSEIPWDRVDLNMCKDPAEQAKMFKRIVVEEKSAATESTQPQTTTQSQMPMQQNEGQIAATQTQPAK